MLYQAVGVVAHGGDGGMSESLDDLLDIRRGDAEAGEEHRHVTLQGLLLQDFRHPHSPLPAEARNLRQAFGEVLDDLEGTVSETLDDGMGEPFADALDLAAGQVFLDTLQRLRPYLEPRHGREEHAVLATLFPVSFDIQVCALADLVGMALDGYRLRGAFPDSREDAEAILAVKEDFLLDGAADMDVLIVSHDCYRANELLTVVVCVAGPLQISRPVCRLPRQLWQASRFLVKL